MTSTERRASIALAGIFTLRMLGLFMIFPIFSLDADLYSGNTATLTGLAIGIYGLTQALFQIPFGRLSDRIGRKKVIVAGLIIFAAGSAVAASADSIWGVIIGRALQGFGAIAAAVLALTADLTREEQRTKAMAIIGVSIGMAFALAMVAGPALKPMLGLSGLFWLTGVMALLGIGVLLYYVPTPARIRFHRDTEAVPAQFAHILRDPQLLRLDLGILVLHLMMTATFVVLPLALRDYAGFAAGDHWKVYLFVLAFALALMAPLIMYADRHNQIKRVFLISIVLLLLSQIGLYGFLDVWWLVVLSMILYFTGFTALEASLPSLISRLAPSELKGTALGVYSTAQYLGAFLGGVSGGWLYGNFGISSVFAVSGGLCAVWLLVSAGMRNPLPLSTHLLDLGEVSEQMCDDLTTRLLAIAGVAEAVVVAEDGIAYLKVDRKRLDREALRAFSATRA
ncbi:MAG: MFS transporter [Gammaproteobacteria bacterium]|nr:MAG: MFS transporter [Gammaproteobacteria bacterium]